MSYSAPELLLVGSAAGTILGDEPKDSLNQEIDAVVGGYFPESPESTW